MADDVLSNLQTEQSFLQHGLFISKQVYLKFHSNVTDNDKTEGWLAKIHCKMTSINSIKHERIFPKNYLIVLNMCNASKKPM